MKLKAWAYADIPSTPPSGMTNYTYQCQIAGWQATGPVPLSITTSSLPDSTVGIPYSQQLQATGGTGSYTWSLSLGSLPAGLTLAPSTGIISGTPTTVGTSNFTAQVSDGSTTATKGLSITVTSAGGTQKLIGADDATPSLGTSTDALLYFRFQAEASGNVSIIKVKGYGTGGHAKVGICSDSSGSIGTLLNVNNTSTAVSSSWTDISIASTAVTSGTYYWLVISTNEANTLGYVSATGGTMKLKAWAYADIPSTPPSGMTNYTYQCQIAGWATPSLPPDAAPILASPGASVTFKWGAADRATTYWLQVNTQSDFNGSNLFNAEVGNVTTQEVTGLSLGITYYWRVKAGNASGWGPWSSVRSVLANTMP
jgi:hypothetical protein